MRNYFFIVLIASFFCSKQSIGQVDVDIFFGSGYINDTCSVSVSYFVGEDYLTFEIIKDAVINSNNVIGLAKSLTVSLPRRRRVSFEIKINERQFLYRLDKYGRKSQLRIDLLGKNYMDFYFLYKGGFRFY